jgi:hypothetical protein
VVAGVRCRGRFWYCPVSEGMTYIAASEEAASRGIVQSIYFPPTIKNGVSRCLGFLPYFFQNSLYVEAAKELRDGSESVLGRNSM